ncbi:MAG TPA: hypothetical protein VN782_12215 [Usitatibacter sp.]|nr:hypothetical protein [Usitatibacter sp.]
MAKTNGNGASREQGAALAVEMLRELQGADLAGRSACGLSPEGREPGKPQRNIVRCYLEATQGDREMEAGFTSVLSDFIASCASGCIPDARVYRERLFVARG